MDPALLLPSPDAIPVPWGWFQALLLFTFFCHILLMNVMLGTACIALAGHFGTGGERAAESHRLAGALQDVGGLARPRRTGAQARGDDAPARAAQGFAVRRAAFQDAAEHGGGELDVRVPIAVRLGSARGERLLQPRWPDRGRLLE